METMVERALSGYTTENSVRGELHNNLVISDALLTQANLDKKVEFYILGGAALALHGIKETVTLDIDLANKLSKRIRDVVDVFIDDAAAEVSILPTDYVSRLVPYAEGTFVASDVFLLSLEDLFVVKAIAGRNKDFHDLYLLAGTYGFKIHTVREIIQNEIEPKYAKIVENAIRVISES